MVQPIAVVGPRVAVGVEVDQRQRPVLGRVRPQQGIGDEVIAAERQQERALLDDLGRVGGDPVGRVLGVAVVQVAVAVVGDRELGQRIEPERVAR